MGKDGYASPDDGRRRKKAGARVGSISLSSWQMGVLGFIGLVVLAGLLTMIALGTVAFSRSQDVSQHGGDFLAEAEMVCLSNQSVSISAYPDNSYERSGLANVTALLYERVGNLVQVTAQFLSPFTPGFSNSGDVFPVQLAFFVDARCIPPASGFVPCNDNCMDNYPWTSGGSQYVINFTDTSFAVQLQVSGIIQKINDDPDALPAYLNTDSGLLQATDDAENVFYGVITQLFQGTPATNPYDTLVESFTLGMTYYTNASSSWRIPDHCRGGLCQIG
jgi:hypothetical protein